MFTVLIAEDELLVRLGLKNSINWEKYDMKVIADVSNGLDAYEIYKKEKPDLILTDLKMPKMDGIELISKIRSENSNVKIVILTCIEEFDMAQKAVSFGVSEYILKVSMTWDDIERVLLKVKNKLMTESRYKKDFIEKENSSELFKKHISFLCNNKNVNIEKTIDKELLSKFISERAIVIAIMRIDNYSKVKEVYIDWSSDKLKNEIDSLIEGILSKYKKVIACKDINNDFIIMFDLKNIISKKDATNKIIQIEKHLERALHTYFNASVFFCNSSQQQGYEKISFMYKKAKLLLDQKYFNESNILFSDNEIDAKRLKEMVLDRLYDISDVFKTTDCYLEKRWKKEVDALISCIELTKETMINHLIFLLHFQLPTSSNLSNDLMASLAIECIEKINESKTFFEAIENMKNYFISYIDISAGEDKLSKEIYLAVKFISDNYQYPISLNEVADEVALTPNYLSALFKKELKINFIDYINHIRIEQSKVLLLESDMKVYMIREKVGFSDNSYFGRVFKKHTGLTPNEFKKGANCYKVKG